MIRASLIENRQRDKETRRPGEREKGRQGPEIDQDCLLVSLSPCLLVFEPGRDSGFADV
jgi:hypothetical protein